MTVYLPLPTTPTLLSHTGKVFFWQETENRLLTSKTLCPVGPRTNLKELLTLLKLDKGFPWCGVEEIRKVGWEARIF